MVFTFQQLFFPFLARACVASRFHTYMQAARWLSQLAEASADDVGADVKQALSVLPESRCADDLAALASWAASSSFLGTNEESAVDCDAMAQAMVRLPPAPTEHTVAVQGQPAKAMYIICAGASACS